MTIAFIAIIILLIAYILDGYIRKKLYVTDVNLARVRAKKEFGTKSQAYENVMNRGWQEMIHTNNYRYGIIGEFNYDIKPTDKYGGSGEQTFIGTGIVLDRKFVSREDIVNDMAAFYQKDKKAFIADPKELRDRYIVIMYIQDNINQFVQDNMNQFVWEDKDLYDNVERGEKISISYNEKGPLYIGYKLKGEQNDPNPKRKLDMGSNKKVS